MSIDAAVRPIEDKLLAFCRAEALFCPGDTVIAACSGGADSVAMLLFLARCRAALGITLKAAHVDHGIRGQASRDDAAFVAGLCRQEGIELFLYDAAAEGVAVPAHPGEDWARRLRYGWFDALAAQQGAKIALAHTMNDQAETLLFRLARGSGVRGMGGMAPCRGAYRRPFLCLTRAETERYCQALGQGYVQDATNLDETYARNRLRRQAVPAILEVNPAALFAADRFARRMRELDAWLRQQGRELLAAAKDPGGFRLETLRDAPAPVLEAALLQLLAQNGCAPQEKRVQALCGLVRSGSGCVQAAKRLRFLAANGHLVCDVEPAMPAPRPAAPQPALPGKYRLPGGYRLTLEIFPAEKYEKFIKNAPNFKKDLNSCADYDKIGKNLLLRTRQPGDHYAPRSRCGHKSLKKYFNEQAVPLRERALLPLLACGSEVVWLWGSGFAGGLAPEAGTRTVLLVQCPAKTDEEP